MDADERGDGIADRRLCGYLFGASGNPECRPSLSQTDGCHDGICNVDCNIRFEI